MSVPSLTIPPAPRLFRMTNRIDWKKMTIAAVGLLALVFNPTSDRGQAVFAKYFAPVEGSVEQASARSQEALAEAQMRMVWERATSPVRPRSTLVEQQACVRAARAQAALEAQQARMAARELRAELRAHRTEFLQGRNLRLLVVKSTDAPRLSF
jgi:hypothetical protein